MTGSGSSGSFSGVAENKVPASPVVIPNSQLVILRERELDCDLATAIERVRADESTSRARILVVGSQESAASPDADGIAESPRQLPCPRMPDSLEQVAHSGGEAALEACGHRLGPQIEDLLRSVEGIQDSLDEVIHAVPVGIRMPVLGHLKVIREIVDRMETRTTCLGTQVRGMIEGNQLVDVEDLCRELPAQVEPFFPKVRLNVVPIGEPCEWWGRPIELAEALFLGCVIASHRISGEGSVNLHLQVGSDWADVRIVGLGEPADVCLPAEMARLREVFVDGHGGRIVPDVMGHSGTGMVLRMSTDGFPTARH